MCSTCTAAGCVLPGARLPLPVLGRAPEAKVPSAALVWRSAQDRQRDILIDKVFAQTLYGFGGGSYSSGLGEGGKCEDLSEFGMKRVLLLLPETC